MGRKTKELDVDFIGEQGVELTLQEQHAISEFIRQQKNKSARKKLKKRASVSSK